jgi:probable rRNA maturation factor
MVEVQLATKTQGIPAEQKFGHWVNCAMKRAMKHANLPADGKFGVTVRIIDEDESQALNSHFRDIPKPTNVLAFPVAWGAFPLDGADAAELGDLAICAPVVAREAAEQSKPLEAHFAHMTVHGSLHLAGYDHLTEEQAEEMESLETQLMAGLGFPDPYQDIEPGMPG